MRYIFVVAVLEALALPTAAHIYYVDPRMGDDGNSGLSPQTSFRTLARATTELRAGDVLELAQGAVFRETLRISASGTAAAPIVVRGNGAVLTGNEPVPDESWQDRGSDLWVSTNDVFWGACRPRVLDRCGKIISMPVSVAAFKNPKLLKHGEAVWNKSGIWFRSHQGKHPREAGLTGFYRVSGVVLENIDHVVICDLTAENFSNDGFNIHGTCRGLVFRNIVARWNGDDGFSVHEDVDAKVYGLHTHHNDYGIQDIGRAQSAFVSVVVESNRLGGVDFYGGMRTLRDADIRDNGSLQIAFRPSFEKSQEPDDPSFEAAGYLESVRVTGGNGAALTVYGGARVVAKDCQFENLETGVFLEGGRMHLSKCTVKGCGTACIREKGLLTHSGCSGIIECVGDVEAGVLDLQHQIDVASPGGTVRVPPGEWVAKPFRLKSDLTLVLERGAHVYASTNLADYATGEGERVFVSAVAATNLTIRGRGVFFGRGGVFKERGGLAGESQPQALPVMMRFSRCVNLRLEDFTYRDCGAWGCHLRNCDGVTMRRVKCFNHVNNTNDGIDIESSNVIVEDCDIDSDDDAVVFKTESDKSFPVTNVIVRNCRLASCCSALKFGTGSYCDFRDIRIEDCVFDRPKGNFRFDWKKTYADRGVHEDFTGLSGMSLEVVDGGRMEGVSIRNIDLKGYIVPIFIRLARRHVTKDPRGSYLRNILIENVRGECATSRNGCSITGLPDLRPSNITLRNVSLVFPGGGTEAERDMGVPELERDYPEGVMFGRNLPAWAFYLRHADKITFDNVNFALSGSDAREMITIEDCTNVLRWVERGSGTNDTVKRYSRDDFVLIH